MADFRFLNGELRDRSNRTLGKAYNNEIRDSSNRTLCKIYGEEIRDTSNRTIGKVYSNELRDSSNRTVIKLQDVKKEIEGVDYLDPKIIYALWISFVKRGI